MREWQEGDNDSDAAQQSGRSSTYSLGNLQLQDSSYFLFAPRLFNLTQRRKYITPGVTVRDNNQVAPQNLVIELPSVHEMDDSVQYSRVCSRKPPQD
mmetsp:Transcript_20336/g.47527  ORF Transcript_20336/g.47527 Transcript_20336/m.47527 type:complete len:97 (-) Transcript_20336:603-893(-)